MILGVFSDLRSVLPEDAHWSDAVLARVDVEGFDWLDFKVQNDVEGSHVAELGRSNVPRPRKGDIWFRAQVLS
jgi:hypothetical protein